MPFWFGLCTIGATVGVVLWEGPRAPWVYGLLVVFLPGLWFGGGAGVAVLWLWGVVCAWWRSVAEKVGRKWAQVLAAVAVWRVGVAGGLVGLWRWLGDHWGIFPTLPY